METFEFTLSFRLPNSTDDPEQYLDALYEAGCDDTMVGMGQTGHIALEFTRPGKDLSTVVNEAIDNVMVAIEGAVLIDGQVLM